MWPLERKLWKQKSRDNYHLGLYLGQSNFYLNALSNLISIKPQFFLIYILYLCHKISKTFVYKLEEYFVLISIYGLSTCRGIRFIILEYYLMTRSEQLVRCNQTSSLGKLSTLLLVLVRVYWLDDKSLPSCSLVMIKTYWLDSKVLNKLPKIIEPDVCTSLEQL